MRQLSALRACTKDLQSEGDHDLNCKVNLEIGTNLFNKVGIFSRSPVMETIFI